jgi:hypothetical protein
MVQVTNALEGRAYTHHEWALTYPWSSYPRFPEDYTCVKTQRIIPNDTWAMSRPYGWTWLVGSAQSGVTDFQYVDAQGQNHVLYLSDKPFGYICADDADIDTSAFSRSYKPVGARTLVCARQIHKGEFGQTVPVERLHYVRQAYEPSERPNVSRARDRKRSNLGWIRLVDLAVADAVIAAGLTVEDIILGYWDYSGHRNSWEYSNGQNGGQLLDMVVASSSDDIARKCPQVRFTRRSEARGLIDLSLRGLWVRRGFANTVLRLLALGVRPDVMQSV